MEGIQSNKIMIRSFINDYKVLFIKDYLRTLTEISNDRDVIIIDKKIFNLYNDDFILLRKKINFIILDANENQKSFGELSDVIEKVINSGLQKSNKLIGIGGGIIQDVTSFISSILFRGIEWIFIPTSLLAMGDSCIGSKTSINFKSLKNQLGGFYPPSNIYIDTSFLKSLPIEDIKSGLGEMCHYFIISSKDDFDFFKKNSFNSLADSKLMNKIIYKSLNIKKRYIELDEFDKNERQVFNYGHTFGHAIEGLKNYSIPHGIAVTFGMDMANFISFKYDLLDEKTFIEIREFLKKFWKGYTIKNIHRDKYMFALSKDKKNKGNQLGLILVNKIGDVFKKFTYPDEKFESALNEYFDNYAY